MERGKYQLSLNYEGVEMLVVVDDLETATNLLNGMLEALLVLHWKYLNKK